MQRLSVLALHGFRQDADLFANKLGHVTDALADVATFTFAHGPFEASKVDTALASNDVERSWFPGSASQPLGSEALSAIDSAAQAAGVEMFDIVVGFSQGCIAALALTALDAQERPLCCRAIRAVILCASPAAAVSATTVALPSLHVVGEGDAIVPPAESLEIASAFASAEVFSHPGAHSVPRSRAAVDAFRVFLERHQLPEDMSQFHEAVAEELAVVEAVFGDALVRREPDDQTQHASFSVVLSCELDDRSAPEVLFRIPPQYPQSPPTMEMVRPDVRQVKWGRRVVRAIEDAMEERLGTPMLFEVINVVTAEIENEVNNDRLNGGEEEAEGDRAVKTIFQWDDLPHEAKYDFFSEAYLSPLLRSVDSSLRNMGRAAGGRSKYVVGLVGKPSAGKSSFFNAVTDPASEVEAAKIGAFPFTTIEPNFGDAFVGIPCGCGACGIPVERCGAEYGHFPGTTLRRYPVLVKDVAGLVPGAYQGRGKGNRFLNDLCDASVLVHVVDGSGTSAATGEQDEENPSGPIRDVEWIRHEIHAWIFDNVRAKWEIIVRKPLKFFGMFSGYHMPLAMVEGLFTHLFNVKPSRIVDILPDWGAAELHLFIAAAITCRFPTVIALNKADHPNHSALLGATRAAYPDAPIVAMAARAEIELVEARRQGFIQYVSGGGEFTALKETSIAVARSVLTKLGSTGVTEVLRRAFALRPCLVAFPSKDLSFSSEPPFKRAVLMQTTSTVEDLARTEDDSRAFARVEIIKMETNAASQKQLMKREARLPPMFAFHVFFR